MQKKALSPMQLALGGVLAALVFVMTYLPKIPVPVTGGYIHAGDGMIFLAAMVVGPVAAASAAIGSALSDLAGGYMVYILPTFIIKGLMGYLAWKLYKRDFPHALLAFAAAEAVMVLGYFLFEAVVSGVPAALGAIGPNVIQGIGGVVIGLLFQAVVPRLSIESSK